jgi:hypothetical protein
MNGEIITCTIILLKDDQIHYLYVFDPFMSLIAPVLLIILSPRRAHCVSCHSEVAQDQRPGGGEHYVHGVIVIRYGDDPDVAVATVAAVAQIDASRYLA